MSVRLRVALVISAVVLAGGMGFGQGVVAAADQTPGAGQDAQTGEITTLRTSVRRVVVDVVVTDRQGRAVPGLKEDDFQVEEDHVPQKVMSFEANGFSKAMTYVPPALPAEPVNTYVNLPTTPELGPLYVLLYDLVNMDSEENHQNQITARQELVKFIEDKPAGARYAIFANSDGLHLVCGFTSDKSKLFDAIDPKSNKPHMPKVFLMGENLGRGDEVKSIGVFHALARYLSGMPGRKNLIWFAGRFPLSFYPDTLQGTNYAAEVKSTLNLLMQEQISLYPVSVNGAEVENPKGPNGLEGGGEVVSARGPDGVAVKSGPSAAGKGSGAGGGVSYVSASYNNMDRIAEETGGRAYYSTNHVAEALRDATENGDSYYTLSYAPSHKEFDGKLRKIEVKLEEKGYTLEYRRSYFAVPDWEEPVGKKAEKRAAATASGPARSASDAMSAAMRRGAPTEHRLIFGLHVMPEGSGLVNASSQGAGRGQSHGGQSLTLDYTVMTHQLMLNGALPVRLEVASTTYDSEGNELAEAVDETGDGAGSAGAPAAKSFRVEQKIGAPAVARWLRVAIRDLNTNRIGAMEVALPVSAEGHDAAAQR